MRYVQDEEAGQLSVNEVCGLRFVAGLKRPGMGENRSGCAASNAQAASKSVASRDP